MFCAYNSWAQNFAPSNVVNANDNINYSENTESKQIKAENTAQPMLYEAEKNLNPPANNAPVYENKDGKVFGFRMVNGKIVFDNDEERSILVYYDNVKTERGMDGIVRCSFRVYVLNDMEVSLNSLGFKLLWPKLSTTVQMDKVNPGVRTYMDTMLLGEGCFDIDKTPTIEVNRCRVKGMSESKCADAVKWFQRTNKK